jgi:hypothetical protein
VRKVLITFAILNTFIGAAYASWIYGGRQLSLFIDQFGTIKIAFGKVNSIAYQGGGTAGVLIVNDVIKLRLNEAAPNLSPSIGSTKDNQLALANGGKVFAFGPLACSHCLATAPHAGDDASLIRSHSALSWPTPFDLNVMNGESPSWRRHIYYQFHWKKSSGATLDMFWRYEQDFYTSTGWGPAFVIRQASANLVRLDIRP